MMYSILRQSSRTPRRENDLDSHFPRTYNNPFARNGMDARMSAVAVFDSSVSNCGVLAIVLLESTVRMPVCLVEA